MLDNGCNRSVSTPREVFQLFKYKYFFRKNNPDFFYPAGLVCFYGPQGSGKTLSAVNYVQNLFLKYPNCKLVTNLKLTQFPVDNVRVFEFIDSDDLLRYKNDDKGVIFLIDEIQIYFNSLESKNISIDVIALLSQQRKQRLHIVCTSQVFDRMAKPLREQFDKAIECHCYFQCLQVNLVIKRDLDLEDKGTTGLKRKFSKRFIWLHKLSMYNSYDTYVVIKRGNIKQKGEKNIYGYDNNL